MQQDVQSQSRGNAVRGQEARSNTETRSLSRVGPDKAVKLLNGAGNKGAKFGEQEVSLEEEAQCLLRREKSALDEYYVFAGQ